jgi:hypothetical protein
MSDYQLTIKLEGFEERAAQVRVWIDDPLSGDLSNEKELALVRDEDASWSGCVSAEGAFIYRIGIFAASGTRWSLSVRDDDAQELLFDSDELTMPKEWLVGTCEDIALPTHLGLRSVEGAKMHF